MSVGPENEFRRSSDDGISCSTVCNRIMGKLPDMRYRDRLHVSGRRDSVSGYTQCGEMLSNPIVNRVSYTNIV